MRIAVSTPHGNVGRHLVRDLVRAGVRPRLLEHTPGRTDAALAPYVEPVPVDLLDEPGVRDALVGVDALHLVLPPGQGDDPVAGYAAVGEVVTRAAVANGVGHVVLQSSVGAELRGGAGEIDGLALAEQTLDAAADDGALRVTHLRCGFFFTNLLLQEDALRAGVVPVLLPVEQAMPWVAPRDIAGVAAALLLQARGQRRRVQAVHGPRDLSWAEATRVVSAATGRQVRAVRVEDDEMRAALAGVGMTKAQVEGMVGMSIGLREGFVPEQPRDATSTTETTLEAWAYDVLRPRLG